MKCVLISAPDKVGADFLYWSLLALFLWNLNELRRDSYGLRRDFDGLRTGHRKTSAVLTAVAMTNVGTTSLFMMYEPEIPQSVLNNKV